MKMTRESSGLRWKTRSDGPDKVTGKLKFLTDLEAPDMLIGKVLRSAHPHASILSIHTEKAKQLPGVHGVLTYEDVPGMNLFGIAYPDQPVFCSDRVRYVGDAIAAVAAENAAIAERALSLIEVEYEKLPVLDDPEKALNPDAPRLHPGGNILHRRDYKRGNIEHGFSSCAHIVEETYDTPRQMHTYMETEGGLFVPETGGRLTVYSPTQHGFKDRMQLSRILAIPEAQIRVCSSPIGGSFGGKDELNVQPYGSLLAMYCQKPVKMHNSRWESVRAGIKRHPMKITMKTGMDAEGRLLAHQVRIVSDTGAYATLGAEVLNFAVEHVIGPYQFADVDVEALSVYTNNGVSGEFRGFGGNQAIFALESQIDKLAHAAGMDPWELRKLNLRKMGDPGPFHQRIAQTDGAWEVWQAALESNLWRQRREKVKGEDPWIRYGTGAAIAMHGAGLGFGVPDHAGGRLSLLPNGKFEVAFGFEEVGQGLVSSIELLMKDVFGFETTDLQVVIGDTDRVPHSGSSTASRCTSMIWMALQRMKEPLVKQLLEASARVSGLPTGELTLTSTGVEHKEGTSLTWKEIACQVHPLPSVHTEFHYPTTPDAIMGGHYLYTYTSVVVKVMVNLLTGQVKVLDQFHAVAAGPVVNPLGYLGQIEGGSSMAHGFTLTEDAVMVEGEYMTKNLDTYMIPTIRDHQGGFELHAIEELPEHDVHGPRGIGEVGSVALAPAITSAVYDAVGCWITKLPIAPEELQEKWARERMGV